MTSEIEFEPSELAGALAAAGRSESIRTQIFESLRRAEREASDPLAFREEVRWPVVLAMLQEVDGHRVELASGVVLEVGPDSRIDKAILLSLEARPDHFWEPQTTKLILALGGKASNAIVGGAYIGDQAIPLAKELHETGGTVHAFEPMDLPFRRLVHNVKLNNVDNLVAHQLALWDGTGLPVEVLGHAALGSPVTLDGREPEGGEVVGSVTIDDYVRDNELPSVELITLDTEGGEERALFGARGLMQADPGDAPHIVFEIHRHYVDWTYGLEKTSIVEFLLSFGYEVFAIRDFHSNYSMLNEPIEIVPVDRVYLEGPPHGFNMLATKSAGLVEELGLRIVPDVSPKLLLEKGKDPRLHHPTGWL